MKVINLTCWRRARSQRKAQPAFHRSRPDAGDPPPQGMARKMSKFICPMCTMCIDGANGVAQHIAQNMDSGVVAAADPKTLRDHARNRGWNNVYVCPAQVRMRLNTIWQRRCRGRRIRTVSVFTKDGGNNVRHSYTAHPRMAPGIQERGIDLLAPAWNFMDLTPQGRGAGMRRLLRHNKAFLG